jgi:hypothetical protein
MAISIIGTPQVANANNGGTVTCTFSTTPSEGDYTVAVIGSPAATAAIGTISTSGYSLVTGASHTGAAAANPSLAIWYKKQGASPDTTVAGTSGNGSDTDSSMIAFVLRGVDPTTFSDATPTTAGETSSTNPDPASITVGTAGACVIVAACMTVVMDTSITAPSGYTGYSQVGNDTYDHTLAAAYKLDCSGTEAPASWTGWSTGLWFAITIAVKPYVEPTRSASATETCTLADSITVQVSKRNLSVTETCTVQDGTFTPWIEYTDPGHIGSNNETGVATISATTAAFCPFTCYTSMTARRIVAYMGTTSVTATYTFAIYADNGGVPGTKLYSSSTYTHDGVTGWHSFQITETALTANTKYHLAVWTSTSTNCNIRKTNGPYTTVQCTMSSYPTWENNPTASIYNGGTVLAIYADYDLFISTSDTCTLSDGCWINRSREGMIGIDDISGSGEEMPLAIVDSQFTCYTSMTARQIGVYWIYKSVGLHCSYAIYSDNSDLPDTKIASTTVTATFTNTDPEWIYLPISDTSLTAGTKYWLVVRDDGLGMTCRSISGPMSIHYSSGGTFPEFPTTLTIIDTKTYKQLSIIATDYPQSSTSDICTVGETITITATEEAGIPVNIDTVSETCTVGELIDSQVPEYYLSISDTCTLADSIGSQVPQYYLSVSETCTLADLINSKSGNAIASAIDVCTLSDAVDGISGNGLANVSDICTLSDSITPDRVDTVRDISATETCTLADLISSIGGNGIFNVSDTCTLSDSISGVTGNGIINISETCTLADSISSIGGTAKDSIADTCTLTDSIQIYESLFNISASDTCTLADSISAGSGNATTSITEICTLTDTISIQGGNGITLISDTCTLSDAITIEEPAIGEWYNLDMSGSGTGVRLV